MSSALTKEDKGRDCGAVPGNRYTDGDWIPAERSGRSLRPWRRDAALRDWLALGIATYDEYPDIYNFVGGRFFSEFVPSRNYWFTSESHHQGSAYGSSRHECELWSQWLIYRMSGETVYIPEMSRVVYQWIYTRRPDGQASARRRRL